MLKKQIFFKLVFSLMLLIISADLSFAAAPKNYDAVIYTTTNHRYKGFLEDVSEKGVTIDYFGHPKFIDADSIQRVKIKRSTALKSHALTAATIGLLAGIPIYMDGNAQGKLSLLALPVVLIGTTLSGAVLGSVVNSFTHVKNYTIRGNNSFKSIYPVLLRYSEASPSRKPIE